jgi:hypothetical protein
VRSIAGGQKLHTGSLLIMLLLLLLLLKSVHVVRHGAG